MPSYDRSKHPVKNRHSRSAGFWKLAFLRPKRSWADRMQGEQKGQALVLLAVAFFALLAFIGLVTDVGSIYVSYTQLQRAVDSAAISAANNIKNKSGVNFREKITEATKEFLLMHNVSNLTDLKVYICSDDPSTLPATFLAMCQAENRKLAYIEATQASPVYFLQLFGVRSFPVKVTAVGETAAVDLVLVIDTSESMASEGTTGYNPNRYNPNLAGTPPGCNLDDSCHPLKEAKDAAKLLAADLFDGYDRVAVVTFSYTATLVQGLTDDLESAVPFAIDSYVNLHDDRDNYDVRWSQANGFSVVFNPIYPEDRDGDGKDTDPPCTDADLNGWDDNNGDMCDQDNVADVIDWNHDGVYNDGGGTPGWYSPGGIPPDFESTSILSTCSGCGIRVATETLMQSGRAGAVWVIVYLSDGVTNLSDTHNTYAEIPNTFIYGFCGPTPKGVAPNFWSSYCIDTNTGFSAGRYCIDSDPNECPSKIDTYGFPNFIVNATSKSGPYSAEDYAFDMVDRAALTYKFDLIDIDTGSPNYNNLRREPQGEEIVIFSIGLGTSSAGGINLLHYLANVGDEGARGNDLCAGRAYNVSCGNYYYSPTGERLKKVFESIAGRIFTKISR